MNELVALDILHHCDRTTSQEARHALRKFLWDPLRSHNIRLTPSCILSPENDILGRQETAKHHTNNIVWRCDFCGKQFSSEHCLDMHLARRHSDERNANGTICFADFCGRLVPCVPLTSPTLPSVSTTTLRALTLQNKNVSLANSTSIPTAARGPSVIGTDVPPVPAICGDAVARSRRIQACSHIVSECLHSSQHRETDRSIRIHVDRLRVEMCERAIQVECIPRNSITTVLGNANTVLQTKARFPTSYVTLWTVAILLGLLVISCFWKVPDGGDERIEKKRRPRVKPKRSNYKRH